MSGLPPRGPAGDEVRATVSVGLRAEEAFRVFTEEVNLWWRRGRRFRSTPGDGPGGAGIVCIEPRLGGRLFESFDTPAGERVVEMGEVLAWEPPQRVLLRWRAVNFAPGEHTEVEVLFRPLGALTQVTVVHRGWLAIRADHPVRHGHDVPAFLQMMGLWWGALLTSLRERGIG